MGHVDARYDVEDGIVDAPGALGDDIVVIGRPQCERGRDDRLAEPDGIGLVAGARQVGDGDVCLLRPLLCPERRGGEGAQRDPDDPCATDQP